MTPEQPYERELIHAMALAREVGEHLLPHYGHPPGVKQKSDGTWVCDMDIRASDIAISRLKRYFPDYGIVEEETRLDERGPAKLAWVVDPLDSSRGYIQGISTDYSVLISLLNGFNPILGVSFKPHKDELIWAIEGRGAYLQEKGQEVSLRVSSSDEISLIVGRSRRPPQLERVIAGLNLTLSQVVSMSGSSKFLEVAKGAVTAGYQSPENPMQLWDLASGQVIVKEAGGYYTAAKGDKIDFSIAGTAHLEGLAVANSQSMLQRIIDAHQKAISL